MHKMHSTSYDKVSYEKVNLPEIDISSFLDGSDKKKVIEQVNEVCKSIGFFSIVGHGIPENILTRCCNATKIFFKQDITYKNKSITTGTLAPEGYHPLGSRHYENEGKQLHELNEWLYFGSPNIPENDPYYNSERAKLTFARSLWVNGLEKSLKNAVNDYFSAMDYLCYNLWRIFALALDLDEYYFTKLSDKKLSFLKVVSYPHIDDLEPVKEHERIRAHTDGVAFTCVKQYPTEGFQVLDKAGRWLSVCCGSPNSFAINIGDLLQLWTGYKWVSTTHRVILPSRSDDADNSRLTLAFGCNPNYDVEISNLKDCEDSQKFNKFILVDYIEEKLSRFRDGGSVVDAKQNKDI